LAEQGLETCKEEFCTIGFGEHHYCVGWGKESAVNMTASAEMEAQLVHLVQESLAQYLHRNACFMCERLVADFPTEVRSQGASLLLLVAR
jgi:hypothetical protein